MPAVTVLDVSNNLIDELPALRFSSPSKIKVLDVSRNNISSLKPVIFTGHIIKLNLQSNRLSELDDPNVSHLFDSANVIEELNLSDNGLTRIPISVQNAASTIQTLLLENNLISNISSWQKGFHRPTIEKLSLAGNQLYDLQPGSFEGIKLSLQYLDITNNNLITLQESFLDVLDVLNTLLMNGNPLICNCDIAWLRIFEIEIDWPVCSVNDQMLVVCFQIDSLCEASDRPGMDKTHPKCNLPIPEITTEVPLPERTTPELFVPLTKAVTTKPVIDTTIGEERYTVAVETTLGEAELTTINPITSEKQTPSSIVTTASSTTSRPPPPVTTVTLTTRQPPSPTTAYTSLPTTVSQTTVLPSTASSSPPTTPRPSQSTASKTTSSTASPTTIEVRTTAKTTVQTTTLPPSATTQTVKLEAQTTTPLTTTGDITIVHSKEISTTENHQSTQQPDNIIQTTPSLMTTKSHQTDTISRLMENTHVPPLTPTKPNDHDLPKTTLPSPDFTQTIISTTFDSRSGQTGAPEGSEGEAEASSSNGINMTPIIIGIVAALVVVLVIAVAVTLACRSQQKKKDEQYAIMGNGSYENSVQMGTPNGANGGQSLRGYDNVMNMMMDGETNLPTGTDADVRI